MAVAMEGPDPARVLAGVSALRDADGKAKLAAGTDGERALHLARSALSTACHCHAYELPPTSPELLRWLKTAEEFDAHGAALADGAVPPVTA
jgi:hypothetical protein